jgi:hypothetical protein
MLPRRKLLVECRIFLNYEPPGSGEYCVVKQHNGEQTGACAECKIRPGAKEHAARFGGETAFIINFYRSERGRSSSSEELQIETSAW